MKIAFPFLFVLFVYGCKNEPVSSSPEAMLAYVDSEFYLPEEARVRQRYSPQLEGALKINGPVDSMHQFYIHNGKKALRQISYFQNGLETKRRNYYTPKNYSDTYFDYGAEKKFQVSAKGDTSNLVYYQNGRLDRKVFPRFVVKNISTGLTDSLVYPNKQTVQLSTFDKNGYPLRTVNFSSNMDTERNFTWENNRIVSYDEERISQGEVISSKYIKWKRGKDGLIEHITLFDSMQGEERGSTVEYKMETTEDGTTSISPVVFGRVNNTYIFDKYGNWVKNIYSISGIEHIREYFYQD